MLEDYYTLTKRQETLGQERCWQICASLLGNQQQVFMVGDYRSKRNDARQDLGYKVPKLVRNSKNATADWPESSFFRKD